MPKLSLYNKTGSQVGEVNLNDNVFGVEVNKPVVHRTLVAQMAAMRSGTHKTKTRGEVKASGKKPWRQKGTGRARQGSTVAPHWVGGGNAFGPSPRSYAKKVNKKEKRLALKSVLSNKVEEGKFIIVDSFSLDQPKTKEMANILAGLKVNDKKTVIILPGSNEAVYKSARNIPNVKTVVMQALNVYDLLNCEYIVATKDAVAAIEEVLA